MIRTVRDLVILNLKTFFRQPEVLFWALLFPLALAWVLGVAFDQNRKTEPVIGWLAAGPVPAVMETLMQPNAVLPEPLTNSVTFRFKKYPSHEAAVTDMKTGKLALYMEVGETLTYYFDPQNPAAQTSYLLLEKALKPDAAPRSRVNILRARGSRYIDFLIPGLLAMNIMSSCLWGTGWGLIEMRMKKYLRRLMATPIRKTTFLAGVIITRICITTVEMLVFVGFARFYFNVVMTGNPLAFGVLFLVGNYAFSGVATLIASRTDNSIVGNGLLNAVLMPMMLLSGIFFSYQNFPDFLVPVIRYLPLTLLADSTRALFLEGAGFPEIMMPVLILGATGTVCYVAGLKLFRWY